VPVLFGKLLLVEGSGISIRKALRRWRIAAGSSRSSWVCLASRWSRPLRVCVRSPSMTRPSW